MPSSTGNSDEKPRCLAAVVTREEALEEFRRWRRWWWPKPRSAGVELVHLPVHLFVVTLLLEPEEERREIHIAVDGLDGTVKRLDASVVLSRRDEESEVLCEALIESEEAREKLAKELPVQVLQPALRHRGAVNIEHVRLDQTIGYPCWVEHLGKIGHQRLRVLDGLSRARVGSRGQAAVLQAIVRGA